MNTISRPGRSGASRTSSTTNRAAPSDGGQPGVLVVRVSRPLSVGVDVALPAGEVAVVRGDYRTLPRARRERPLVLVRLAVP